MRLTKLTVAVALAAAGCSAPFTYPDLAKAKETYAHAQKTGSPDDFPAEFAAAKKSIGAAQSAQDAQAAFERGQDPSIPRDLSAEALYRAEVADKTASAAAAAAAVQSKEAELAALQAQWDAKANAVNANALDDEAARAKREADEARRRLAQFAEVKEDERGTLITLAGGIPFKTGSAKLQPVAVDRLKIVADALHGTTRTVLVTGYTDITGPLAFNEKLSKERADVVAQYLVKGGLPAGQVRTEGKGPADPIGDNKTAAGRAKNRRVEILLEKPKPQS
jgi:outer membrane protein OmpA-like peptidoglycan-associated protein